MRQTKARRRLPLEMESEIFKFLKEPTQTKFIWRMGRGIYGMFGHQLFMKSKRLCNPKGNHLSPSKWYCPIPADGIVEAFTHKGFDICVQSCRMGNFPGTVLYYFEVTKTSVYYFWQLYIGLSYGQKRENILIYSWPIGSDLYYLYGERHQFEWPNDAIRPKRNGNGDVYGCGLLLNPRNELAIFFTFNGVLMGKQIPISPESNHLTPTIRVKKISVKINFGDNPAKPFKYDIKKCQGLVFQ